MERGPVHRAAVARRTEASTDRVVSRPFARNSELQVLRLRCAPLRRVGHRAGSRQRFGPMRARLGVEALVGEAQALDGAAGDEVLVDDFGGVFQADVAIPDGLGVDHDGGAVLALIEAAGLVDADARGEAGGLGKLLDGRVELGLAVGVARGARGILGAGIGADKDVAFKRGQARLLGVGMNSA